MEDNTEISEITSHYEPFLLSKVSLSETPQVKLFRDQVILNPTISKINFYAFLLFDTYIAFIFLPITLLQGPLLRLKYDISEVDDRADVTYITNIFRVLYKIMIAPRLAYCCDRFGRRTMITIGVILVSIAAFLLPNLPDIYLPSLPDIYPEYPLVLLILDTGILCLQSAPLLADYIDYETKGRVSGITVVISFVASTISTYSIENMDLKTELTAWFYGLGIFGLILGLVMVLGLKEGLYHKNLFFDRKAEAAKRRITLLFQYDELNLNELNKAIEPNAVYKNMKPGFMAGIREARNPWILTGYICTFLFMQNHALFGFILITYVTDMTQDPTSVIQAYALNNRHMIVGCLTALIFGFYADKRNKFKLIIFILFTSMFGVLLLILTPSPYNVIAYISMGFLGMSSAGYKTIMTQLLGKYATPKFRASVAGIESICGVIGASTSQILGVYLTKEDPLFPFVMNLSCSFIGLFLLGLVYVAKRDILMRL